MMPTTRRCLLTTGAALAAAPARAALPDKPIRVICPWAAGGTFDAYLRGFAPLAGRHLGRSVLIENRPGAAGAVGMAYVKGQPADGSTLVGVTDASWRLPLVQRVDYDGTRDFTHLAGLNNMALGFIVLKDSPIRSIADLVERAKAQPEGLSVAGGGTPASPPFGMKLLELRTGIRFLYVPVAGPAPALNALLSKTVDLMFDSVGSAAGMIDSGEVRLLGVTTPGRSDRFPQVPSIREQGFDVSFDYLSGIAGPPGMAPEVSDALIEGFRKATMEPEHATLLARLSLLPAWRAGPDYAAYVSGLYRDLPPVLRAMGLTR
ncbi:tripartite tricarboxylate transporter substrate binding protein [Rhodovarius crocodyli]|nr:tripartite tricarboxylate transporter substrate binding protein [Rhodovarius crocodyli]